MRSAPYASLRPPRGLARAMLGMLGMLGTMGCAEPAASTIDARPALLRMLEPWGLAPTSAPTEVAMLAWHAPSDACPQVYRISTSYAPNLRFEEDSTSWLVLGRDPKRPAKTHREGEPIRNGEVVAGRLYYHGLRAERDGASRDVSYGRELFGPAAPSAGCLPQTWDPMEDAFALGWPALPGRIVAVGERWNGLRVEGKCNRAACVDPLTGAGGPDNHDRACVTEDWQETLLGIYELEGERYAWIGSTWTDGHEGKGIDTERFTLVSIDHGRPVWSQTVLTHRFSQPIADGGFAPVVRTWRLEAVDDCEGALPAAGWDPPPHEHEALVAEITRMREGLADVDALRRRGRRGKNGE